MKHEKASVCRSCRQPGLFAIITVHLKQLICCFVFQARLVSRLLEVASGMAYLNAKGVLHSDLKAANVLLKRTVHGSYGQVCV